MDILKEATTFTNESSQNVTYIINTEGLVSLDELSNMSYTTPLSLNQMNTLFPMNEINND